ncbi:hypothetical protein K1X76_05960 [bacterium]|nr:hypothetical protein [bacterium]
MSFFLGNNSKILFRPESAMAIHLLSSIVLLFSESKGFGWFDHMRNWPRLFSFFGLFFPVFGAVMALPIFLFCRFAKPDVDNPNYYEDEITPELTKRSLYDIRPLEERLIEANDVLSLADIMMLSDDEMKRGAIDRLVALASPESVNLLMSMRSSASADTRFYVTSGLEKIRKKFEEEIEAAHEQLKEGEYKVSARIFLAKVYQQYAESGLVNSETAAIYYEEAKKHLLFCFDSKHVNTRVVLFLLELLFKQKNYIKALDVLEKARHMQLIDFTNELDWRIRILFEQQRYQELTKELRQGTTNGTLPSQYISLAQWWGVV